MAEVKTTCREELLAKLREDPVWDVVVIGGGATGAGIAVDAASRGLKTVVLEAQDFSSGTSSRSTKLIHGGVRYMKNPRDWGLVREALKERRILIKNAPHLVHSKPFILPCYKKGEREFYTIGLGIYSAMTYGGYNIGHTSSLSREDTLMRLPGVKPEGLMGGVQFFDGQFDDARLDVALIRTAYEHGAVPLNYMPVVGVTREGGMIRSVTAKDKETGEEFVIRTKMVFNAAGAWVDPIRRMVDPDASTLVRVSRGSHILLDKSFMPGDTGMLIPKTHDGRVLFAIPWHGMLPRRRQGLLRRPASALQSAGHGVRRLDRQGFSRTRRHSRIRQHDHRDGRQVDGLPQDGRARHARRHAASPHPAASLRHEGSADLLRSQLGPCCS